MAVSRHLVDPELLPALEAWADFEFSLKPIAQVRAQHDQVFRQAAASIPRLSGIKYSERVIPGPPGAPDVRVLVFCPTGTRPGNPAYLHIHGGGYVLGNPDAEAHNSALISHELGCVVVSVAYRLAPETVFPGAVEDCYAALKWLYDNSTTLGVDKNRIAIGGASAGGGLAAGLALLARDRKEIRIIHQQLIYPMIDDRPAADPHPVTGEYIWTQDDNRFGWSAILGHPPGGTTVSPYAAAARETNLAGLPSTFLSVGALDLFLEENMDYARRLIRAGVPVEFHLYSGAYHGFDVAYESRIARNHVRDQMEALRTAFTRTTVSHMTAITGPT